MNIYLIKVTSNGGYSSIIEEAAYASEEDVKKRIAQIWDRLPDKFKNGEHNIEYVELPLIGLK